MSEVAALISAIVCLLALSGTGAGFVWREVRALSAKVDECEDARNQLTFHVWRSSTAVRSITLELHKIDPSNAVLSIVAASLASTPDLTAYSNDHFADLLAQLAHVALPAAVPQGACP